MELYATCNKGWAKLSEDDEDAKNAKPQSSTILEEMCLCATHRQGALSTDDPWCYCVWHIIKVLMFSLQAPRCATFDEWHHKLQNSIEDLNLIYGEISWDQIENATDTLDQIIRMVTKWDTAQVTSQLKNTMERNRDMGRHTKTLHIVASLLDIQMIQQDMANVVDHSAATETECSYCKCHHCDTVTYSAATETDCSYCK